MRNLKTTTGRISRIPSRFVHAALALAVVFATAVVATPSAHAQTFALLYSFQGPPVDGAHPSAGLIFDELGNLYGTTSNGGTGTVQGGTAFEVDRSGNETLLHSFTGAGGDGALPGVKLIRYAGNTYGVTGSGGLIECGSGNAGCGTIFELSRSGESVVYSFTNLEGNFPQGLSRDQSGNFYGTTANGGIGTPPPACGPQACGTVFQFSQGKETVLYSFRGFPDGQTPNGDLLVDRSGNLYGTTQQGGAFARGTVFELSPNSDGTWTEHVLYNFRGKSDGRQPLGGVVMDLKGSLYGTTLFGGIATKSGECLFGCGVVFKLRQNPDNTWTERVLYMFGETADDGEFPNGSLVRDKQGNLYGVTQIGGASNAGIVFEVDAAGQESVLHTFTNGVSERQWVQGHGASFVVWG